MAVTSARPGRSRSWPVALVLVLVTVVLCAGGMAAQDITYLATERAGTVTVDHCTYQYTSRGKRTYTCTGDFVSDDGRLRVPSVDFTTNYGMDPGDRERVTVPGPGARTAHPIGYLGTAISLLVALVALTILTGLLVRRWLRRVPGPGRAYPPPYQAGPR